MAPNTERLTWFELQVCPDQFRFAVVPRQPILIGVDGETILVTRSSGPETFDGIVAFLEDLVRRFDLPSQEMVDPELAFEDDVALMTESLHLRVAHGEDGWASVYPLDRMPERIEDFLAECQAFARELLAGSSTEVISGEEALEMLQPPEEWQPEEWVQVKITRTGDFFLNGQPATLDELQTAFAQLAAQGGGVLYHREEPDKPMTAQAGLVLDAIMAARLPLQLCEFDFDQADGRSEWIRPRE